MTIAGKVHGRASQERRLGVYDSHLRWEEYHSHLRKWCKVGSADVGKPPPQDTSKVYLGRWQGNTLELLDGMLDEVAIFSVALSEDDMKNLMKKGFKAGLEVAPLGKLTTSRGRLKSQ